LISLQETKKEKFKDKTLRSLSHRLTKWIILPSIGRSGEILVGINEDKLEIINQFLLTFSITLIFKNKTSGYVWMYSTIYGSTINSQRNIFWQELSHIRSISNLPWLIGGDFNVVRYRSEKKGRSFNHSISNKFNSFINTHQLIDLKMTDRKFTWSNLRKLPSFACLDRFLCTTNWEHEFPYCISKSLPRYSQIIMQLY
jgi:hypothetical protein